ncbi:MAG: L-lactate permease, partial [Actinobacteria bacterium]|nr:L-lactate permease [Actinomycetota bacterium]
MYLAASGFTQHLDPLSSTLGSTLVALIPIALLLLLLAVARITAWLAVTIGAVVTLIMATAIWQAPVGPSFGAWGIGAGTGIWSIDWIVFWGVVLYNTLVETGAFAGFQRWLITQATADIRVQTILLAWSLGALLEGLVGFGYPWAVIAPILVGLGVVELEAIRVAAIANNAPVSYGALGAPILALAAVTGAPLLDLSASVGRIVAILALLPPWILIALVSGRRGIRGAWPLALVGSLSYIAGQFPTSQWLGPYLPDIIGALVSFGALLLLLRFWRPKETLGFGGVPITAAAGEVPASPAAGGPGTQERVTVRHALPGLAAFGILIVVVVAATGPWSHLGDYTFVKPSVTATGSLPGHGPVTVDWKFAPAIAGTWILVSWLIILVALRARGSQIAAAFRTTFRQMWGALLVAPIIFGLAQVFNYSGMAST